MSSMPGDDRATRVKADETGARPPTYGQPIGRTAPADPRVVLARCGCRACTLNLSPQDIMRCFGSFLVAVCATAGLAVSPAALRAQFPADIQAGTRVRVWVPEPYAQVEGPVRRQLLRGSVEAVSP